MIFNSAGHHIADSGAVAMYEGKQIKENEIMMRFRDKINKRLKERGYKYINDTDNETLSQYLNRIKPGIGSVVGEGHLNASVNKSATGIEVVIPRNADTYEKQLASMIAVGLHKITGLPLRNGGTGVISEGSTARGSLGIMRKQGIIVLIEYGFISNPNDMKIIFSKEDEICKFVADCYILAEDWLI